MYRSIVIAIAFALVLTGCSKPKTVVVLDGWWNIDFAKDACRSAKNWMTENSRLIAQVGCDNVTSCKEMTSQYQACLLDESGGVSDFQIALASKFAADTSCNGVQFIQFNNPSEKNNVAASALTGRHWMLSINYTPGRTEQDWSLLGPSSQLLKGQNTVTEIARKVCSIANERGASISN